jgi:predicted permease
MVVLLSSVLPVVCIVAVGAIADRTLQPDIPTLSRLILYVLSPALIVDVLYRTEMSGDSASELIWGFTIIYFVLGVMGWLVGRLCQLPKPTRTSLIATTAFPNTGNMGLSISLFALGEAGLDCATVVLLVSSVLVFSTGPALLRGGGWRSAIGLTLRLPLIWAVVLGLGLRLIAAQMGEGVGSPLPFDLDRGLDLLAQATIPVALLMLGMQISRNPIRLSPYTIGASLMRSVGGGWVAMAVTWGLGIGGLEQQTLILQCAMPAAVTSFVMASELGGDGARTGQVVAVSTLLSFVTLPCWLWAIGVGR